SCQEQHGDQRAYRPAFHRVNPPLHAAAIWRRSRPRTSFRVGLAHVPRDGYCGAMDVTTTQRLPARALALPNLLTYARIVAVPVVVACMYWQDILGGGLWLRWVALAIFVAAAITDFLDGYFARILAQQSTFGRMLDPIADKLLVASCL